MEQYISKSALVEELEKRRDKNTRNKLNLAAAFEDNYLLSFLNILEVKEMNSFNATVCKIDNIYLKEMDRDAIVKALESYEDGDKVKVIITKNE